MISKPLSEIASAIAPTLGNHIWQSTLFAILAALLALALRKNHARARYSLWFAASVKFLIPFSLLVGLGSHLPWSRISVGAQGGLYFAMEQVNQPFTQHAVREFSRTPPSVVLPSLPTALPIVFAVLWLCGFVTVLLIWYVLIWYVRWQQISLVAKEATPLREGREVGNAAPAGVCPRHTEAGQDAGVTGIPGAWHFRHNPASFAMAGGILSTPRRWATRSRARARTAARAASRQSGRCDPYDG